MISRGVRCWLVCIALLIALPVLADTRVTLSKDAVAMGEPVVLTIETDQPVASPDLTPLRRDFSIGDIDSSRQVGFDGQGVRASQQIRIELRPLRSGMLAIPALVIGNQRTAPLVVEVLAAGNNTRSMAPGRSSTVSTQANGPVFIDTVFDDTTPYVQQAVGVTVRLHYAVNLFNGEFRQPEPPQGASLQPMGNDSRSMRVVNGRQYQVLERHYLLLPERSGALRLPGASFNGEGESGFFDGLFGDGREIVSAEAPSRTLQVQPIPPSAGQPWLPARQVSMRVASPPTNARAGEAFDVVVELRADGVTAMQLPELQITSQGAQIFAQPAQSTESFANGRPQVVANRRFSIVPQQAGELRLQVAPVAWWDVAADASRRAEVAPVLLKVAPGSGRYATSQPPQANAENEDAPSKATAVTDRLRPVLIWVLGVAALVLMGLLVWWASRRRAHPNETPVRGEIAGPSHPRHTRNANESTSPATGLPSAHADLDDFRRAVKQGDLATMARVMPLLAKPPLTSLAEVRKQLDDHAQIEATSQLERALWADGDADAARAAIRGAFAKGPRWKVIEAKPKPLLAPLYPDH